MEKANQSGVYTGPKNAAYAEQQQAEKCWSLECAKNGHPEAGRLRTSSHCGTKAQLHENRKLARRALNAICASAPNGEFPADVQAAFDFGAGLISRIDSEIDHHEQREEAKANKSGINAMRNHSDFARHYRTDNQFGDAGEIRIDDFLRGVANMSCSPAVRNALTEGTDSAGGYTVPSVLMPGILAGLVPVSSLLQAGASIIPLDAGGKNFTYAAVNAIPTAAWRSESGSLATSDATFRSVVATPRSLAFQFKISRELLADGQGISEALYVAIAASFARELDRVGLRGTGSAPAYSARSRT